MDASLDPNKLALTLLQTAQDGNWRAAASLAIVVVVFAIRSGALRPSLLKRFPGLEWFKTDRGGVTLNFLVSFCLGLANTLIAKQPVTISLVTSGIVNACISAGIFTSAKRLLSATPNVDEKPDDAPKPDDEPAA